MSEQTNKSLSQFMKKQIGEKSSKKIIEKKSAASAAAKAKSDQNAKEGEEKKNAAEEEMTDEEKLEEAKKASKNKAGERDQTEMIKKLILENIVKYTVLISVMVIFAIGVIKFGPAIVTFFNGLLYKTLMGALGK